jgi:hypothetical protein
VAVQLCIVRIKRDSFLSYGKGFVLAALSSEDNTQPSISFDVGRIDLNGKALLGLGLLKPIFRL